MKIGIIGTRGIPNRYGGFERFVELLVSHSAWKQTTHTFRVYGENASQTFNPWTELEFVGFTKNQHPLRYYWRSTRLAVKDCDAILCCGVGISLLSYWPRLNGKHLILNPDGCEWRRTKWSSPVRSLVRAMYLPAISGASRIILDSEALREDFNLSHKSNVCFIPYQAPIPKYFPLTERTQNLLEIKKPFALTIARLEPENNLETIVTAFSLANCKDAELIIIGPKTTPFYKKSLARFDGYPVRFLGPLFEQSILNELRSNCFAYLHGHSVGGTNPSLLEALSTVQGQVFCHDNKYNRETAGFEATYFDSPSILTQLLQIAYTRYASSQAAAFRQPSRDPRYAPDTIQASYQAIFDGLKKSSTTKFWL